MILRENSGNCLFPAATLLSGIDNSFFIIHIMKEKNSPIDVRISRNSFVYSDTFSSEGAN